MLLFTEDPPGSGLYTVEASDVTLRPVGCPVQAVAASGPADRLGEPCKEPAC